VSSLGIEPRTHALKGRCTEDDTTLHPGENTHEKPCKTRNFRNEPKITPKKPQNNQNLTPAPTPVTAITAQPLFPRNYRRRNLQSGNNSSNQKVLPLAALLLTPRGRESPLEHTPGHLFCPACQQADAQLRGINQNLAAMDFPSAARFWMQLRSQSQIAPRTQDGTRAHLEALHRFFHALTLAEITPGHLRAYQIARTANALSQGGAILHPWPQTAGHDRINHELGCLGQILKQARLWANLRPFYFPLHIPKWSPRTVLSENEELRLWEKAAALPAARLAYLVATITNNTTAAGCELRGLRLKDVQLAGAIGEIYVSQAKNIIRPRRIALNSSARWAVEECLKRALRLGSCEPEHFLFPFYLGPEHYLPTRQASPYFLRKSWEALRRASGFHDLKPHDLRHHCITRMLEEGVEPETVRAIAGHVTVHMMDYYAHQRTRVKYAAVMAIEQGREAPKLKAEAEAPAGQLFAPRTSKA